MELYVLLIAISSVTTLTFGKDIVKQRWGYETKSNVAVIGGKNASIEDFPFMASFTIEGSFLGSGVILNKHWILTTAFIAEGESLDDVQIRIGSDKYDSGGMVLTPHDIVSPSKYSGGWNWDICLIQIKKAMKFGKTINRIRLGSGELKNKTKVTIAGWGSTSEDSYEASETMTSTKLTVLDKHTCSSTYGTVHRKICTFNKNIGPFIYDFGDPLILKNKVYGLFAGGDSLYPGDNPLIYTDVTKYRKWIKSYIGKQAR